MMTMPKYGKQSGDLTWKNEEYIHIHTYPIKTHLFFVYFHLHPCVYSIKNGGYRWLLPLVTLVSRVKKR